MVKTYVAFDLETTGLNVDEDNIIEIGAVKVENGKVTDRFMEFVRPEQPISSVITNITGITDEMVSSARETGEIVDDFLRFCGDYVLVGHNIIFDYKFMKKYAGQYGHPFEKKGIDTLKIARKVHRELESKSLEALCEHYEIINSAAHRAYHDALATAKLYHMLAHYFEEKEADLFVPEQLLYKLKKVQPATSKQLSYLKNLRLHHGIDTPVSPENLTRSEASRLIDQIISRYGNLPRDL